MAKYRQHGYQDRDRDDSRKGSSGERSSGERSSGERSGTPHPKKDNTFGPETGQSAGHAGGFTVHAVRHGAAGDAAERAVSEVRV